MSFLGGTAQFYIYIYPDSCGGGLKPVSGGGRFNKMSFRIADLLVSCGRMADSCKKCGFKNSRICVDGA